LPKKEKNMTKRKRTILFIVAGLLLLGSSFVLGDVPAKTNPEQQKLALLIGIDEYKYVNDLEGAVNDVENVKALLVESFGFLDNQENIRILTNQTATREAIQNELEHLIAKATSDSIVVVHYSGHGSFRNDISGDELDGKDETLVTYDSSHSDPSPNRDITDDELNDYLRRLTAKTPNVTVIFDSCHSGTALRGSGLVRTVAGDTRKIKEESAAPAKERKVAEGNNDLRPEDSRYVLLSGCAGDELSREYLADGKSYGAMSWHLVDQIRRAGADATYRDIMDQVKMRVSTLYPTQHPQLEGPGLDQLVFSANSRPQAAYALANPKGKMEVKLRVGQVHGVTEGSLFDVYPPETKVFEPPAKPAAQIEITEVGVTRSVGKILKGGPVIEASRAVERERSFPPALLHVYFKDIGLSKTLRSVKAKLAQYKHIAGVETEEGYDLLLREKNGFIITEGGEPTEISPRIPTNKPDAIDRLVTQVTHWAKWFNLLRIENQGGLPITFAITAAPGARGLTDNLPDKLFDLTVIEKDIIKVTVSNNASQPMYIALLDISSDGSVEVVYPRQGQEEFLAPGKAWSESLETFVPEGRDSIRDVLKVFATTTPVNFSFLRQGAVRGAPGLKKGSGAPLEELLSGAAIGTSRGTKLPVKVASWTTESGVIEVRRAQK
jgi:Caspase domain